MKIITAVNEYRRIRKMAGGAVKKVHGLSLIVECTTSCVPLPFALYCCRLLLNALHAGNRFSRLQRGAERERGESLALTSPSAPGNASQLSAGVVYPFGKFGRKVCAEWNILVLGRHT